MKTRIKLILYYIVSLIISGIGVWLLLTLSKNTPKIMVFVYILAIGSWFNCYSVLKLIENKGTN